MDEIVVRAMQKWPDVPHVYGWLRLDRRGNWLVKSAAGGFERIGNPAVQAFIARNYDSDATGRWFFQNGPQRVYVALDYTPWVYCLSGCGDFLESQTGVRLDRPQELLIDDAGGLLVSGSSGPGVVSDRDLSKLLDIVIAENPSLGDGEALLQADTVLQVRGLILFGCCVPVHRVERDSVAARYGFDPDPRPAPGVPDC